MEVESVYFSSLSSLSLIFLLRLCSEQNKMKNVNFLLVSEKSAELWFLSRLFWPYVKY